MTWASGLVAPSGDLNSFADWELRACGGIVLPLCGDRLPCWGVRVPKRASGG